MKRVVKKKIKVKKATGVSSLPKQPQQKPEQWKPPFTVKQPLLPVVYTTASEPAQSEPIALEAPKQETQSEATAFEIKPQKIPGKKNPKKAFLSVYEKLTCKRSRWDIWSDFVTMFACTVSNSVDMDNREKREELYLSLTRKYDRDEQNLFSELAVRTILALEENPDQDFLGDLFMELGLGNEHNGQFFTPYEVCKLMASVTLGDVMAQVNAEGYITVTDPCCGAGATLIAAANEAKTQLQKYQLNFQDYILVTGQDIDFTVMMMCYIQLSLLGVAGYFKVGNTLTEPMSDNDDLRNYWFTPMYFSPIWKYRRLCESLKQLMEGEKSDGKI